MNKLRSLFLFWSSKVWPQISTLPLLLAACAGLASGTTLARMSVAQMIRAATLIVRARCISSSARWEHGEIWTLTAFAVTDTWKGSAVDEITVRTLGGSLGNVASRVSGVPEFRSGEEVVLFLEPSAAGGLTIVSWQQGTFRVRRDARTGRDRATQDVSAPLFGGGSSSPVALLSRDETLDGLRREVEAASQATEKQP